MRTTIQDSVLTALQSGKELTSEQIASKFGAGNPQAVKFSFGIMCASKPLC